MSDKKNSLIDQDFLKQEIFKFAKDVFESEDLAVEWLNSRVPALQNRTPLECLKNEGGFEWVVQVLDKIKYGDYS